MRWRAIPALLVLTGCSYISAAFTPRDQNLDLVQGPPIQDVVTAFDRALTCLNGKVPRNVIFGVGTVVDSTGKESYADGNAGKFVTQGAGEMVQSALFKAGVSVVNRRDDAIMVSETNWGIRDITRQVPVNFYVSGSINSLDFIPGGGFSAQVAGIGPRYRQSRILVALDLTMTDAYTGRIVANIPLQKQIFTSEIGGSGNNFFGDTLVQMDAGGMQREAINFALRQMISLATFEVLGQIMDQSSLAPCKALIGFEDGGITASGTADPQALRDAIAAMNDTGTEDARPLSVPVHTAAPPAPQGQPAAAAPGAAAPAAPPVSPAAFKAEKATTAATMAIRAANDSMAATDTKTAIEKAAEALKLSNLSLLLLKEAAQEGFGGDEGEVAAVVVQQALQAAKEAGTAAAKRAQGEQPGDKPAPDAEGPSGTAGAAPAPKTAPAVPAPGSLGAQQKPGGLY
ncbi:hypothetical protein NX862_17415 [Rhodobacter sp. KR11]|uniref:CsgG/HfaB family protein n=1 Tax=Rhodobacter sp. KR11 TaxID=2974588 RepID=UPI002221EFE0|nr:CsgG/HfaB family protein [Rhodobacter sp. KR11]MCW1920540.1 hypothetical protein [Rhodobacter sp. KR11]